MSVGYTFCLKAVYLNFSILQPYYILFLLFSHTSHYMLHSTGKACMLTCKCLGIFQSLLTKFSTFCEKEGSIFASEGYFLQVFGNGWMHVSILHEPGSFQTYWLSESKLVGELSHQIGWLLPFFWRRWRTAVWKVITAKSTEHLLLGYFRHHRESWADGGVPEGIKLTGRWGSQIFALVAAWVMLPAIKCSAFSVFLNKQIS